MTVAINQYLSHERKMVSLKWVVSFIFSFTDGVLTGKMSYTQNSAGWCL